jgi:hypothetical protein
VNWEKLYRIYREERLTVRKRSGRKRALGTRAPMAIPLAPNQRWSLDFLSESLALPGAAGSGCCAYGPANSTLPPGSGATSAWWSVTMARS